MKKWFSNGKVSKDFDVQAQDKKSNISVSSCVYGISFAERTQELEIKIESLETELRENEMEANQVISKWQSSCAEAESKCSIMEEELDHLKATIETQNVSSTEKDEDKAKYIEMIQVLAQKDEELLQLKEESKSSSVSLQKLKGVCCMILYSLVSTIRLSFHKYTHILQTLLLVHRRSIGTEPRHNITERGGRK